MILIVLQIAVFSAGVVFLAQWRARARKRNVQSWDSLLARLRPEWSARELNDQLLWKEGLNTATPDEAWERMEGAKGMWVMFQNARVMMEMADFTAKNAPDVDRVVLETLRSDAMQIRICVLVGLAQYAFTQASEGVRVNAFRAASIYTGMAARLTELLQAHAAAVIPDFVAAM